MAVVDLDMTGYDTPEQAEAGDRVPVGWYMATVEDHFEDANNNDRFVWEFKIAGGIYDGRKLFYHADNPQHCDDVEKQKKQVARLRMLASRFGLIAEYGKPTSVDFDKSVNQTVVLEVTDQSYEKKVDGKGTGVMVPWVNIAYAGVYPLDHDKIPDNVRAAFKLPAARKKDADSSSAAGGSNGAATTATAPPAPRQQTADAFADL